MTARFDPPETDEFMAQLKSEGVSAETRTEQDGFDGESSWFAVYVNADDYEKTFLLLEAFE